MKEFLDRNVTMVGRGASLMFYFLAAATLFEIISRYFFSRPTFWVHETSILLCAFLFMLSGVYCVSDTSHIRITLVHDYLSATGKRVVNAISSACCLLLAAGLTWSGWIVAEKAWFHPTGVFQLESSGTAWDPIFPALTKLFVFLTFLLFTLLFLLRIGGTESDDEHD